MNSLKFEGKGFDLFKIRLIKFIVTVLSLGLLYPWGKLRELKYLYRNTSLSGKKFEFNGNFKTYFHGYLQTWLLIFVTAIALSVAEFYGIRLKGTILGESINYLTYIVFFFAAFYIASVAYFGRINYRSNNTSNDPARMYFTGKSGEMVPLFLGGYVLSSFTLSLYWPFFVVKILKYSLSHLKLGNITFDFKGSSKEFFSIYWKGFLLGIVTFGIYYIWLAKQIYEYMVGNIVVNKDGHDLQLVTDTNQLQVFELIVGNVLLTVFTLGIGYSWAKVRLLRFIADHSIVPEGITPEAVEEEEVSPAKQPFYQPVI